MLSPSSTADLMLNSYLRVLPNLPQLVCPDPKPLPEYRLLAFRVFPYLCCWLYTHEVPVARNNGEEKYWQWEIERQQRCVRQLVAAQVVYVPGLQLSAISGESPIGGCRSSGNPNTMNSMVCSSPDCGIDGCLYVRATFVFWDAISKPLGFLVTSENPYAVISFEMASFKPLFPPGRHTYPSPLSTQGYIYTSIPLFRILIPIK